MQPKHLSRPRPPAIPKLPSRPSALVTIGPVGRRAATPLEYLISLTIDLVGGEEKHRDRSGVMDLTRKAFAGFARIDERRDELKFSEPSPRSSGGATGVAASLSWPGRPGVALMEQFRAALSGEGYRVTMRETRECTHSKCNTEVQVPWTPTPAIPSGWYKETICGKHQYRTCGQCHSVYLMSSTNAAGQAPSVRCEVCDGVLVAWGASKLWHAELVSKGVASA